MGETRRKFDADFREGAVRLVRETGKPIAQVARDPWPELRRELGVDHRGRRWLTSASGWRALPAPASQALSSHLMPPGEAAPLGPGSRGPAGP
jgi:hypothetical protein